MLVSPVQVRRGGARLGSTLRSKTGAARFNSPQPKVPGEKHHRTSRQEIQLYCRPLFPSQVPLAEELVSIAGRQNRLSEEVESQHSCMIKQLKHNVDTSTLHLHFKEKSCWIIEPLLLQMFRHMNYLCIKMFVLASKIHFSTLTPSSIDVSWTLLTERDGRCRWARVTGPSVDAWRKKVCVQQLAAGWTWTQSVSVATRSNKTAYRETTDERLTPPDRSGGLMDACLLIHSQQVYYGHTSAELWAETPRVPFLTVLTTTTTTTSNISSYSTTCSHWYKTQSL